MPNIQVTKRHTFQGHSSGIFCLQVIDESNFVSAGGDGQVVKWDIENLSDGKVIAKVNSTIYGLLIDGDRLLVGENNKGLHMIEMSTNKPLRSVEIKAPIFAIERVEDQYLIGTGAGELFVFDLSLNMIQKLKLSAKSLRAIAYQEGHLALGYSDNSIRILSSESREPVKELLGHSLSVFALQYHPETKVLISTGRDAHIRVWDRFADYQCVEDVAAHSYASNHLSMRKDASYFATGSMDKTIKIWDATTFALVKVIDKVRHDGHSNSVNKVLWMDFNNLLVTCSDDRSIAVWDIKFD